MNKRIKELAIQSGAWDHYEINEGVDGDEKPLEKFAELIAQETMNALHANGLWNRHISDALREHWTSF